MNHVRGDADADAEPGKDMVTDGRRIVLKGNIADRWFWRCLFTKLNGQDKKKLNCRGMRRITRHFPWISKTNAETGYAVRV